jgi:hypothetical protein
LIGKLLVGTGINNDNDMNQYMTHAKNISLLKTLTGWPTGVDQVLRGVHPIKTLFGTNQEALVSEGFQNP